LSGTSFLPKNKTPGLSVDALDAVDVTSQTMHVGNSVALLENEKDGIPDVLFGHVGCSNLVYLLNSGTKAQARFGQANYDFPSKDPVQVALVRSGLSDGLMGMGLKEIIVSTNTYDNAGYLQDFQHAASVFTFQNGSWTDCKRMPFHKPT
jgi:hypothetical protein